SRPPRQGAQRLRPRGLIEDCHYRLIHLTHNEVCKGEATFSGSMRGYLPAVVREFCEVEF
ncbi:hypothetical protein RA997_22890, partial [Mycobacteroides abscessus subsp. abscessus]|uniref:hypothetical protein n=1 Tax=Mycobacteroides abscessus TaxID=36809 RepID=UPI003CEBFC58